MRNVLNKITKVKNFDADIKTTDMSLSKVVNHAKNGLSNDNANVGYIADAEAENTFKKSTKNLLEQADSYKKTLKNMLDLQVEIVENCKSLTSKSKDYAGQMGDALARIDKVVVKDFEAKLLLLERFVNASKVMAELEKTGVLQRVANSFNGNK